MVIVRKATEHDLKFMIECANKDWSINDYSGEFDLWLETIGLNPEDYINNFNMFKVYINPKYPQDLYIVNNGQKDVGFFCQDEDDKSSTLGGTVFIHPRACKMSILKAQKAVLLRGLIICNNYVNIEFNVWHPMLMSNAKAIIPELKEYKLYDMYRIMFCKTEDTKSKDKTIERFKVSNFNVEDGFIFDERG